MLAIDHGYFQGPTTGLERVDLSILPLLPHADALMTTRGMVRSTVPAATFVVPPAAFVVTKPRLVSTGNERQLTTFAQASRSPVRKVLCEHLGKTGYERRRLPNLVQLSLDILLDHRSVGSAQQVNGLERQILRSWTIPARRCEPSVL